MNSVSCGKKDIIYKYGVSSVKKSSRSSVFPSTDVMSIQDTPHEEAFQLQNEADHCHDDETRHTIGYQSCKSKTYQSKHLCIFSALY